MSLTVPTKEKLKRSSREAWMTLYFCLCCCCCCGLLSLVVLDDEVLAYNKLFRPPLMALRSASFKEGGDDRSEEGIVDAESMTGVVSVANSDTDAPESIFALKNKRTLAINNNRNDHREFTGVDFDNESSIEKSFLYLEDLFLCVLRISSAFFPLDVCVRQAVSGKRMVYSSRWLLRFRRSSSRSSLSPSSSSSSLFANASPSEYESDDSFVVNNEARIADPERFLLCVFLLLSSCFCCSCLCFEPPVVSLSNASSSSSSSLLLVSSSDSCAKTIVPSPSMSSSSNGSCISRAFSFFIAWRLSFRMNEAGTTKYVNNASAIQLKPRIKKNIDTTVFAVLINSKDFTFCFGHSCLLIS